MEDPPNNENKKELEHPKQHISAETVGTIGASHSSKLSDSDISRTSFKRWHRHLQSEHTRLKRSSFTTWKCCYKFCRPCRWFDSIPYEKKICKCCLTFRTFKTLGTIVLIGVFCYVFTLSILKDDVLPGGTVFFVFLLCITAYITGYILMLIGLPAMLGHLLIGIIFENIPPQYLPNRDDRRIEDYAKLSEKILLVIALIRAGLLLDMSRIKHHLCFIIQLSLFPFCCEFCSVWVLSHFFLKLPWHWSALQGSVLSVVSLASVTSIMQKNKHLGYGEDKDLCTVLVASAVLNVTFGLFTHVIFVAYTVPEGGTAENFWQTLVFLLKEIGLGLSTGTVSGLLISFFPDKRNTEAAALRILVIGLGSFATANIFYENRMVTAAALCCLTLCVVAANMWEELGWHKDNNPVQYFYTMTYYFGQPVALSLLGYTMNFRESDRGEVGWSICVLLLGILGKELVTFLSSTSSSYPTNIKERLFICIAWFSKGTLQVLLASTIQYLIGGNKKYLDDITYKEYMRYSRTIKETSVLGVIVTTPLAFFSLTLLSPILLTKVAVEPSDSSISVHKRRTSIKYIGRFSISE